ncbi:hypothetical protein QC764_0080840 [Podospora pseudoanserina]|uniref:Uncharacterized protein n=1 Tax=Podospora pseudoanserina TaxID=2609844 RepID=A0ABR0I650_9PEZI|nr:hypothetical protein QC764_0080840 [Podospora pseudoanserina]
MENLGSARQRAIVRCCPWQRQAPGKKTKLGTAIMGPRRPKHPGRATICCSKSILLLQFPNLQIFPTRPSSILPCQFQHRSPACLPPNIHQAQFAIRDIATLTAAQAHRRRNRSLFRAHPRRRLRSTATARLQLPLPAYCSACAESLDTIITTTS